MIQVDTDNVKKRGGKASGGYADRFETNGVRAVLSLSKGGS